MYLTCLPNIETTLSTRSKVSLLVSTHNIIVDQSSHSLLHVDCKSEGERWKGTFSYLFDAAQYKRVI